VPTPLRPHDKVLTIRIPPSRRSLLWRAVRRFPFGEADVRNRKLAARAAVLALLAASAIFGVMLGLILVYSINLPQMTELERYRPSTTTNLYDIHGQIFGSFA
jgi:penicillin-binding protein 1A